ncbi:hypothetical protein Poly30_07240 [Planctomycetes bacterium Poly30]|uniref:Cortical protein marker for cell polarity n=1 Tax=Saltatorellus ferox TaxID=2528018 RepID=A0A518EMA8_9BACT|nr:hypothetical protein Poly30_07240 [Planctomycetes bacterium Poly30]
MQKSLLFLAGSALLAIPASAQATFTLMGSGTAADMNSDGTAVVGRDGQGAFLWTATAGYMPLGGSDAVSVSEDGTVVLGNFTDVNGMQSAGRWTAATGWVSIGDLGSSSGTSLSSAYGMSGDGNRATGLGWLNAGTAGAFEWTPTSGTLQLPQLGPNSSRGNCVSLDGVYIGGWDEDPTGPRRASIWGPSGTQFLPLVDPVNNPEGIGEVFGLSSDGAYAVGGAGDTAWLYELSTGTLTDFGLLPNCCGGFFDRGFSEAVSDDGQRVVGLFGSGPFSFVGTIWGPTSGYERLSDVLVAAGANLQGFEITSGTDISPNGGIILGNAVPTGSFSGQWFIATLDPTSGPGTVYCTPAAANSTGAPATISTSGSDSVANNDLVLTASNLPNNSFAYFINSMTQAMIVMPGGSQGTVCVGGSVGRFLQQIQNSGSNGSISISVDLVNLPQPNGLVSVMPGETWNFQAWYRDANPTSTSNLTDAISVTFQ